MKIFQGKLTPWTRRIIIMGVTAIAMTVIICAAATGTMQSLFDLVAEFFK